MWLVSSWMGGFALLPPPAALLFTLFIRYMRTLTRCLIGHCFIVVPWNLVTAILQTRPPVINHQNQCCQWAGSWRFGSAVSLLFKNKSFLPKSSCFRAGGSGWSTGHAAIKCQFLVFTSRFGTNRMGRFCFERTRGTFVRVTILATKSFDRLI